MAKRTDARPWPAGDRREAAEPGADLAPAAGGVSLATLYLTASLIMVLLASVAVAAFVGFQVERSVLDRTQSVTALYIESFVEPEIAGLATGTSLTLANVDALDHLIEGTELGSRVVSFRIWSPDSVIVYSPNRTLIGRRFEPGDELAGALSGQVSSDLSDLSGPENAEERRRWSRLVETYVPVRERGGGRVIAVAEFYQLPDEIDAEVASVRFMSWAVVTLAAALTYLVLVGIVKRGSDTIIRQHSALRDRIARLSEALDQNERLHQRLRLAAERTTALNEAGLRRIGSDLHDGPAQALALALLRLEEVGDQTGVSDAVSGAMEDLRAIAAGLRSPVFTGLPLAEVAERAIREHERRTGQRPILALGSLPPDVPVVTKIAVYRVLQEALSNARRHARGSEVAIDLGATSTDLALEIRDRGPGIDLDAIRAGALGVAGMRERAELLGGTFWIGPRSDPPGTSVRLTLPLEVVADAGEALGGLGATATAATGPGQGGAS